MTQAALAVRSQLIPVTGEDLILPNVAVAEVISYSQAEPVTDKPEWLLGMLAWRERTIPLIAFEAVCGQPLPETGRGTKIAILNAITGQKGLEFYGIILQGIPHLMSADAASVSALEGEPEHPAILSRVEVHGQPAVIPNLDTLEPMIAEALA